jgi:hypothetical protein
MPALGTNRIGAGPLHAAVLDFVGEPKHGGDAGKCRGWRRGEPPICLVDDAARVAAALKCLLCLIRADAGTVFGFILGIDRLTMGGVRGIAETAARLPTLMMLAPAARVIKPCRVGSTGLAGLIADVLVGGVLSRGQPGSLDSQSFMPRVRAGAEVSASPRLVILVNLIDGEVN